MKPQADASAENGTPRATPPGADHIFISYAWENRVAADWLTLRLTAAGYRVWCDRFKLLGGERFPEHIDEAIKTRTFRMLGLLSQHSLHKENPVAERTLALSIGKERGVDFYIPLDLEGLTPTALPWMISSISFIPFADWADGFRKLLKKLDSVAAPRPLADSGNRAVLDALAPIDVIREVPEPVFSNCFKFLKIPDRVRVFRREASDTPVPAAFSEFWPFHEIDERHVASFAEPLQVHGFSLTGAERIAWREAVQIGAMPSRHVVSNLLRQAVRGKLLNLGLREDKASGMIHYPQTNSGAELKLPYTAPQGRGDDVQATGGRHFTDGSAYRYHLAPTFRIRGDMGEDFWAQLTIRVFVTDVDGGRLDTRTAFSRRRHLTKGWFNHQWLTRQLAVMQQLADGGETLRIGGGETLIEIDAQPFAGTVGTSINDQALRIIRDNARPVTDVIDDDHEGGERADDE